MTADRLDDLDEGDRVHDAQTGEVYEVTNIDAEFDEDGIPSGDVTFAHNDDTFSRDAQAVDIQLLESLLAVVDPAVIEQAEAILLEFAQQEIGNYVQRLGIDHDYNGIGDVDSIRDIKAAEQVHHQQ